MSRAVFRLSFQMGDSRHREVYMGHGTDEARSGCCGCGALMLSRIQKSIGELSAFANRKSTVERGGYPSD